MASSGETFNHTFHGGAADRVRDRTVREARQSLKRQAIPPYTVFNLHRFPLFVSLGDMGYIRVPARREGERYGQFVIAEPRFTMRDLGDSSFSAEVVFPELLAQEVVREYADTGGVFLAQGTGPAAEGQIAAAEEAQLQWYRRQYRRAVDAWYRYHQHKFLTDRQRDAARELARRGEIPALPEWVDATQEAVREKVCPFCGEAVKLAAQICRYCRSRLAGTAAGDGSAETQPAAEEGGRAAQPPDSECQQGMHASAEGVAELPQTASEAAGSPAEDSVIPAEAGANPGTGAEASGTAQAAKTRRRQRPARAEKKTKKTAKKKTTKKKTQKKKKAKKPNRAKTAGQARAKRDAAGHFAAQDPGEPRADSGSAAATELGGSGGAVSGA